MNDSKIISDFYNFRHVLGRWKGMAIRLDFFFFITDNHLLYMHPAKMFVVCNYALFTTFSTEMELDLDLSLSVEAALCTGGSWMTQFVHVVMYLNDGCTKI